MVVLTYAVQKGKKTVKGFGWKRRFFVIEEDAKKLVYYKSDNIVSTPLGFVDLQDVFKLAKSPELGATKNWGFELHCSQRVWVLVAEREDVRRAELGLDRVDERLRVALAEPAKERGDAHAN